MIKVAVLTKWLGFFEVLLVFCHVNMAQPWFHDLILRLQNSSVINCDDAFYYLTIIIKETQKIFRKNGHFQYSNYHALKTPSFNKTLHTTL